VLVFGAITGIGQLIVRYGGANTLGDRTVPHYLAGHRTAWLNSASDFWSNAGKTHSILAVGLVAGAVALAVIRCWRPVIFLLVLMLGELTLFLASAAMVGRDRRTSPSSTSTCPPPATRPDTLPPHSVRPRGSAPPWR
jgi:undecaprenyl-diphosphatase